MSPEVDFDGDFNINTDCTFNNSAGSARCTKTKISNYVHMKFEAQIGSAWQISNPNTFQNLIDIQIRRIKFPRSSSNKFPYQMYFQLFSSTAVGATTYIETTSVSVLPRVSTGMGISLEQVCDIKDKGIDYPNFIRFQSLIPSTFGYTLEENEVRVISIKSFRGMRGLGGRSNQEEYPCTSNLNVKCYYKEGDISQSQDNWVSEWEGIDVFFDANNAETSEKFQIIIPDSVFITDGNDDYKWVALVGIYNLQTKNTRYLYRTEKY